MLTAARARGLVVLAALLAALVLVPFTSAHADGGSGGGGGGGGGVTCPPNAPDCTINAGGGGSSGGGGGSSGGGGGGGGGGGSSTCILRQLDGSGQTEQIPCYRADIGWFDSVDDCYWQLINPQPKPGDPLLLGATGLPANWQPGDGAVYNVTCTARGAELLGGVTWSQNPPPGYGGGPDPAVLAQEAVKLMGLRGANIGIAPKKGATGLVGLPVWLWDVPSVTTWGPNVKSVSAGGVTVTATAQVTQIVWSLGDGSSVTCTSPGTQYAASFGNSSSPDCGHVYQQTSAGQSGGAYPIQAVSTWTVKWTANTGQNGTITTTRTSNSQVAIGQLQVLNQ